MHAAKPLSVTLVCSLASSECVVSEKRVEMSDGEEQVCLNVHVRSGDRVPDEGV